MKQISNEIEDFKDIHRMVERLAEMTALSTAC